MPKRIVIVGGGITGLAAAYELEKRTAAEILVLEAGPKVGGKIQTDHVDGFVIEHGPDCFFTRKPEALELCMELGLESELIESGRSEFCMLIGGKLTAIERGLLHFASLDREAVLRADFLSDEGKRAALNEPNVPAGSSDDESVADFFRRRFGKEFSKLIIEPLLAGTHAGHPESLGMRACYPNYLEMERRTVTQNEQSSSKWGMFVSLRDGMNSLIQGILNHLRSTKVRINCPVSRLEPGHVWLADGTSMEADKILVATPSFVAADLLGLDILKRIRHASSAVLTLTYDKEDIPELPGTGFLVPQSEPCDITGATWSSNKWSGRAPENEVLVRVFMGRDGGLNVEAHTDEELKEIAERSISHITGITSKAQSRRLNRWHKGLPQREVGHLELLSQIRAEVDRLPGIYLAGASYEGSGIPDCVRQGREAAHRIAKSYE